MKSRNNVRNYAKKFTEKELPRAYPGAYQLPRKIALHHLVPNM